MDSHKQKNIMKQAVAFVFSFLLTLCFASCLVLIGCELGIFNGRIIVSQLEKTDYYTNVRVAIEENAAELLLPSGLPESIMEGVIDAEEVRHDTENAVRMSLKGQGYKADTRGLEERFRQNIQTYIEENDIALSEETEAGIEQLFKSVKKEYERCMDFPFIKYFVRYRTVFHKLFVPATALFVIMSVVICALLLRLQRWRHRGMRYINYATLAAGWMIGVMAMIPLASKVYTRINVSPKYMYDLLVGVVRMDLLVFLYLFLFTIAIFGGELALTAHMRHKVERRNHR